MPYKDPIKRRTAQREADKRYAARYPLKVKAKKAAWHANQKAKKFGVEGRLQRKDLEKLFDDLGLCAVCSSPENISIDHVVPWRKGGTNHITNIQILCWQCNMEKTYKDSHGSWSVHGEFCTSCGTSERPHEAHGLCQRCYEKSRRIFGGD